jgi:hypothetical protein
MRAWIVTWTVVFALSVLLFLAVELVVVVGGARDLFYMMKALLRDATKNGPFQNERGPMCCGEDEERSHSHGSSRA